MRKNLSMYKNVPKWGLSPFWDIFASVILYYVQSDILFAYKLPKAMPLRSNNTCRANITRIYANKTEAVPFGTASMSSPVSRVLSFKTVIYLRRISLYGSSRLSD